MPHTPPFSAVSASLVRIAQSQMHTWVQHLLAPCASSARPSCQDKVVLGHDKLPPHSRDAEKSFGEINVDWQHRMLVMDMRVR